MPAAQEVNRTPGVGGGKPCVDGGRVRVWDVAVLAQSGLSPDELLAHHPRLTLADVHGALAYCYDNREALDARALEDERLAQELLRSQSPGPLEQTLRDAAAKA